MRVRRATKLDCGTLLDMMQEYHKEVPAEYGGDFDINVTAERIMMHVGAPDNFQCIALDGNRPVGCLAACLAPQRYWSSEQVALDIVLYVHRDYRAKGAGLKMIRMYEEWARAKGCRHIALSCASGITMDRTFKLYERLGYRHLGSQFLKEL